MTTATAEPAAVERLAAPLVEGDFDRDWTGDAVTALSRRGSRDALFALCARRGTWADAVLRIACSDLGGAPLDVRQNAAMFHAAVAWRDGLYEAAGTAIGRTPGWQSHRGLMVLAAVIASGAPFGDWEAAMSRLDLATCYGFDG